MTQRTRLQALVPVAFGAACAAAVCVGVAAVPQPRYEGARTALATPEARPGPAAQAVASRAADASVTGEVYRRNGRSTYTLRIRNAGPAPTGPLTLTVTLPPSVEIVAQPAACTAPRRVLTCSWPSGVAPGGLLRFALVTSAPGRRRLTLPFRTAAPDRHPADNTIRL